MARLLRLAALAACLAGVADAFKRDEMKKCEQLHFCRSERQRGAAPAVASAPVVDPSTGDVVAGVAQADGSAAELRLGAVPGGSLRVRLLEPGAGRYELGGVLLPQVTAAQGGGWAGVAADAAAPGVYALTPASPDGPRARLTLSPLKIELLGASGEAVITLGARQLLRLEPTRPRPDPAPTDGSWTETFNSHTDSKPRGPQTAAFDARFHGAPHAFGLPEHAGPYALRATEDGSAGPVASPAASEPPLATHGDPYRLYNLDVYEYEADSTFGLYGAIPVAVAHAPGGPGGAASGGRPATAAILWHNAAEQYVDVSNSSAGRDTDLRWWAESGVVDLFLLSGAAPADVWRGLARLTGAPQLAPLFSLGYHQCRWNYRDEADARAVDAGFDAWDLPYDVLWLDIEHTNGKRYLTWDAAKFPDPAGLQLDLASRGERRTVVIVDPHVKRDDGFPMHATATREGYYVKAADGAADFEGWCWPGSSSYLDVLEAPIRDWWGAQFKLDAYAGSTRWLHVWNDMNEPSVFNGPEVTMQKDVRHNRGAVEHRDVHNLYGAAYHAATYHALASRSPGQRPFVLSRAFFAGSQRHGAVWTGDNAAQWPHLAVSLPMLLSLGTSGLPFVGADVGGFFGDPSPELLARWHQAAVFYPFFRGHAHHETKRREPWLNGDPWTGAHSAALRERYALLPYLYTTFAQAAGFAAAAAPGGGAEAAAWAPAPADGDGGGGGGGGGGAWTAAAAGVPVARPLWAEFPSDAAALAVDAQLLLGPALLACPVLTQGADSVGCYLPGSAAAGDVWYAGDGAGGSPPLPGGAAVAAASPLGGDGAGYKPGATAPWFVRGGWVVPRRERPRRSTAAARGDPYTLLAALSGGGGGGGGGNASGELFVDDGEGVAEAGGYCRTLFRLAADAAPLGGGYTLSASPLGPVQACAAAAPRDAAAGVERLVVLGLPGGPRGWKATLTVPGGAAVAASHYRLHAAPGPVTTNGAAAAAAAAGTGGGDDPAALEAALVVRLVVAGALPQGPPAVPGGPGWTVTLTHQGRAAAAAAGGGAAVA